MFTRYKIVVELSVDGRDGWSEIYDNSAASIKFSTLETLEEAYEHVEYMMRKQQAYLDENPYYGEHYRYSIKETVTTITTVKVGEVTCTID